MYLKRKHIDLAYAAFQVILHFLGFAAFLGPVVIIELPIAIIELVNGPGFVPREWCRSSCGFCVPGTDAYDLGEGTLDELLILSTFLTD